MCKNIELVSDIAIPFLTSVITAFIAPVIIEKWKKRKETRLSLGISLSSSSEKIKTNLVASNEQIIAEQKILNTQKSQVDKEKTRKPLEFFIQNTGNYEIGDMKICFLKNDDFKESAQQPIGSILNMGEAICIKIFINYYLPKGDTCLLGPDYSTETSLVFRLFFRDYYKSVYYQDFKLYIKHEYIKFEKSGLYKDFENAEILKYETLSPIFKNKKPRLIGRKSYRRGR